MAPVSNLTDIGTVEYSTGSFTIDIVEIDLLSSKPYLVSASVAPAAPTGSSLSVQFASSVTTGFTPGAYEEASTIVGLNRDQYWRPQIVLDSQDRTNPTVITSGSFVFAGYDHVGAKGWHTSGVFVEANHQCGSILSAWIGWTIGLTLASVSHRSG